MRELLSGIHDIQLGGQSSAGYVMYVSAFLLEGERTTLVDTGWPDTADDLVAELDAADVAVDRVILTHDGIDHYGGLDRVMARDDPRLLVPAAETALLDAIDQEPTATFADGDRLDGGLEVVQLTGHTAAPSSLYLPDRDLLIAADVLDGSDRRGLPPGWLLPPPVDFNEDHEAAERSLERLQELDLETVLVFHGSHVMSGAGEKLARLVEFQPHFQRPAGVSATDER